jgi:hypothetical protein
MNLKVVSNEAYLETINGIVKFGNKFEISIMRTEDEDWDDFQLYWYERTDKPYLAEMARGEWVNLIPIIGDGSDVFRPWFEERDPNNLVITLTDPPGINLTAGNSRTLEIFICVSNGTELYSKARLRQELRYNGEEIESQRLVVSRIWSDEIAPLYLPVDPFDASHR